MSEESTTRHPGNQLAPMPAKWASDQAAIAAYCAYFGLDGTAAALTGWQQLEACDRETWRAVADVVHMTVEPAAGSPGLGLKHAVTSNRLGHALAALREIAEPSGDEFPRDTARNALADDAAIRDNVALTHDPQPAAMAEARQLRERIGRLLDLFGRGSAGYTVRLSGVSLAREYRDAGLPVPDRLSHLEGQ